jgi:non-ribosomal peptide synthetase component F
MSTLDQTSPEAERAALPRRVPRTGRLGVSLAQQRLWMQSQLDPESAVHNLSAALRLEGGLDVGALERSVRELSRRHESLRTALRLDGDEPLQVLMPEVTVPLRHVDGRGLSEEERQALLTREVEAPFDLGQAPLLRALLLRRQEHEHVLLLTMHHIVSDDESLGLLMRDLAVLYEGFSAGRPSALPELPLQYVDFAAWQREWLGEARLQAQRAWWRNQLQGAPPLLELPTDRPRPQLLSTRGASLPVALPGLRGRGLERLCRQEGVTPFMVLLAGLQVLLARYSGRADVVVGAPTAGRMHREMEEVVGVFVNTLALRGRPRAGRTFRDFLAEVRETTLGAYDHQDVPLEYLVEDLQPERSPSYAPLFQVMLALRNTPQPVSRLPGLTLSPVLLERRAARRDLVLELAEAQEGFTGRVEYHLDLFERDTVARMMAHLRVLLESAIADPEQRLEALPLLSEPERHQLLREWSHGGPRDEARQAPLLARVSDQAARAPGTVAVEEGERQLTYGELEASSSRLARRLRRHGVGPEVPVGLFLEGAPDLAVAVLAVLKSGGACVPLEPGMPGERLQEAVRRFAVHVVLTRTGLESRAPRAAVPAVCLDAVEPGPGTEEASAPWAPRAGTGLALIAWHWGAGGPEGTLVEYQGLSHGVQVAAEALGLEPGTCLPWLARSSLEALCWALLPALGSGARLCGAEEGALAGGAPRALLETRPRVRAVLSPQVLDGLEPERAGGLETVVLSRPDVARWVGSWKAGLRLVCAWGMDEASGGVTVGAWREQVHSIGRPVAGSEVFLLDAHLAPVPAGVPGELYVGGPGLARGYAGDAPGTAARFIPHLFSQTPGARLLRTGCCARFLADGTLEYLGRMDGWLQHRGVRFQPTVVEAAIGQHPAVRQCLVVLREEPASTPRLMAYVLPRRGQVLDPEDLFLFASERLPDYQMPEFALLDELPTLQDGRVDMEALPAPGGLGQARDTGLAAPSTPVEQQLEALWKHLLNLEHVGVHDNFFALGGGSLLVTQLVFLILDTFQIELPLQVILEQPTIAGVAERIEQARRQQALGAWTPPSGTASGSD